MGELQTELFQFTFNGFLKVAFQGSRITSDAGLILIRELDERLGLETLIAEHLSDSRQGLNTQFTLADLLRQSVYSRLAGYEDLNDAVRVSADPTFRLIGSPKLWDRGAALTSTLHWFETDLLTQDKNLVAETLVAHQGLAARPSRRTKQDVFDVQLQALVRRHANGIVHVALLERLVDLRLGERRVRAERYARALRLLPVNLRHEQVGPVVSAMHVAGPQRGGHAAAVLSEQKQRVVAGPRPDGSWPRWSTTAVSCSPASASS